MGFGRGGEARSNGLWIFSFYIKREDSIEPVFKGAIVQIKMFLCST